MDKQNRKEIAVGEALSGDYITLRDFYELRKGSGALSLRQIRGLANRGKLPVLVTDNPKFLVISRRDAATFKFPAQGRPRRSADKMIEELQ